MSVQLEGDRKIKRRKYDFLEVKNENLFSVNENYFGLQTKLVKIECEELSVLFCFKMITQDWGFL